jgi:hypothetical protein
VDDQVQDVIAIYNREKDLIYLPQIQPTHEVMTQSRPKLKPMCDLFILNTSPTLWPWWWRKSNKKMKQLLCLRWSRLAWSKQRGPISNCQSTGSRSETEVHQNWWCVQGLVMMSQFLPGLGTHWRWKTSQAEQPWRWWAQHAAYEESDRNSRITPSRLPT